MCRKLWHTNKIILLFLSFFVICSIFIYMNVSFGQDEDFTISLIHHSYGGVLSLNSMDVHPPLYYLILKFFIQITTFWTKSVFIQIISARVLSLIFSFVTFISLLFVIHELGCNINIYLISMLFCLIPTLILYSTQIRMYSLSTMCISLELLYLIKFNKEHKIINLVLVLIFAELAAYSHYFGLISGGLFILLFFLMNLYNKKIIYALKLMCFGFLFILIYIPQFLIIQKQFSSSVHANNLNTLFLINEFFNSFIGSPLKGIHPIFILPLSVFLILIIWLIISLINYMNIKFKILFIMSLVNLIITVIIGEMASFVTNDSFYNHRYCYPIFVITAFLFITLLLCNHSHCNKIMIKILLILLLIIDSISLLQGVHQYTKSFNYIRNVKMLDTPSTGSKIYIPSNKDSNAKITCYSAYLRSTHKKLVTGSVNSSLTFGHSNPKLFSELFNNVQCKKIK